MFSHLKSKVNKDTSNHKIDDQDRLSLKNDESSLNRAQSIESLNSNAPSENRTKKKDDIIKKWENKVSNLVATVREKNAKMTELENQIINDKAEYERKLSEIKESSAKHVQSLLDEHRTHLQKLEQDRDKSQKKLQESQIQLDNLRNQRFNMDEENDSLEDLSKQELAKVKHMLILRESEFEKLQLNYEDLQKTFDKLENVNKSLTLDFEKKQTDLSRINKQREIDSEERRSQQTTIRGLITDKDNLEIKFNDCQDKLTKTESLLMNVERSSADLHSKLQQLNREHDQLKVKHNRLEADKVDRESDLKDRIRFLENHLAMMRETDNVEEKVLILEEKCFKLESKNIEEKMLKDNLLKSWSDRVDCLESQIANLNRKISEDSEEISNYNQIKSNIKETYEKQISDLKQDLLENEKKVILLQEEIDEKSNLLNVVQNKWDCKEDQLHLQFQAKVTENENLLEENSYLKKDLKKISDQFNQTQSDLKSKTVQIQKLEDEIKRIKCDIDDKSDEISSLMNERFKRELKLTELNSKVASLESDKSELSRSANQIDTDFKSLQSQLKRLTEVFANNSKISKNPLINLCKDNSAPQQISMTRNEKTELNKKLDILNEQYHHLKIECDNRIKTMQTEVESRSRELEISHADIKELKDQIRELESEKETVIIGLESSEVLKLKNEMEILNSQLMDKNIVIRNQKQQISDLKKMGREIRNHTGTQKWNNFDGDSLGSRNQLSASNNHLDTNKLPNNFSFPNTEAGSSSGDDAPVVVDKNGFVIMDQINFKYLKHVIVKFLISKESEALQLIKAISTLLRLTTEEESNIRKSIEARNSWFTSSKSKILSKSVQEQLKKSKLNRSLQN